MTLLNISKYILIPVLPYYFCETGKHFTSPHSKDYWLSNQDKMNKNEFKALATQHGVDFSYWGKGHTMSIYGKNANKVAEIARDKTAFKIVINDIPLKKTL